MSQLKMSSQLAQQGKWGTRKSGSSSPVGVVAWRTTYRGTASAATGSKSEI